MPPGAYLVFHMLITVAFLGEAFTASVATVRLDLCVCSGVAHSGRKRREGLLAYQACHAEVEAACLFAEHIAPLQALLYLFEVMYLLCL